MDSIWMDKMLQLSFEAMLESCVGAVLLVGVVWALALPVADAVPPAEDAAVLAVVGLVHVGVGTRSPVILAAAEVWKKTD